MAEPIKTPLSPSFIQRVVAGVRFAVTGVDGGWFSPGQPLQPIAQNEPGAKGRAWDFDVAVNMHQVPRQEEAISFQQLRALADSYDLLRLVIETRKDQMCRLAFTVKPRDEKKKPDDRCQKLKDMLRFPDGFNDWQTWLRMVLEDMLVIDAATIYPRPNVGGGLYALEPVDGATIRRVLDNTGRTPLAPEPAYQQVIKGLPAVNYSADEMIYRPRNPRTNRIYGYSPVEQIITTVNIALRRQLHQLQYYTEGSTPDLIMQLPADWNPDQIKQFDVWWQSMLAGNTAQRRKTMFVPAGATPVNTKEAALKDEYDEWLARVVCYAFGISPQAFVKQMNRATADTAKDIASEEGLAPVMQWVKALVDFILAKYMKAPDLELGWDDERDHDPLQQAQINKIYVDAKVLHPDEVRADLGKEPLTPDQKEDMNPAPPPELGGDGEPGKPAAKPGANPDDAGKVLKAQKKKSVRGKPLDRSRPSVVLTRNAMHTLMSGYLTSKAGQYAALAHAHALKAEESEDEQRKRQLAAFLEALNSGEINWDDLPPQVEEILAPMAKSGAIDALSQLEVHAGIDYDVVNDAAVAWARERSAEIVGMKYVDGELVENPRAEWSIEETTRDDIRSLVTTATEEGWSMDQLADQIAQAGSFTDERAMTIARTESATADVQGNLVGYREARDQVGIELKKEWITAGDDAVSEDCEANASEGPIELDDAFQSGASAPPEHPNCRCDVLPVRLATDDAGNGDEGE